MQHRVIGGGLAGLSAAIELARNGQQVRLIEQHHDLGGRAITQRKNGFAMNLGPHALYLEGAARKRLIEWGLEPKGGVPKLTGGAFMTLEGRKFDLVRSPATLATCGFLGFWEKLSAGQALMKLQNGDAAARGKTVAEWLDAAELTGKARLLLQSLIRVSTYCDQLELLSAEAALRQTAQAGAGVMYVDGGWQSMIDAMASLAQSLGVEIHTGDPAESVEAGAILAIPPSAVASIQGHSRALPALTPIKMATLDLALERLPEDAAIFALGLDEPLYYSLHSHWAAVAPEGAALIHLGKYLGAAGSDPAADRAQLERFADLLAPGWRDRVIEARFLPDMVVSHALPGIAGRPDVDSVPGVYVAGDWVGPDGMLADAAVASGVRAAQAAVVRQVPAGATV